ncbi:hypothetical protein KC316_g522 [Hortaea werneckii]|nr:hypothetical protein KC324_g599 [Hortaea werneckii]KAI7595477.1 hypothetical protein KC316_g522 [Hortaea werneckii]
MPGIPHGVPNLELDPRTTVQPHPSSANDTFDYGVDVICAWPVSGQYGPGSRTLYYVLVAACIFARKVDWLRNACLAAALLFPVIAALHGIVLATVHIDGAADLDIYGAFQFCAIAILVAPMTARVSRTYFKDHGRNAIFVWSVFVVAEKGSNGSTSPMANEVGMHIEDVDESHSAGPVHTFGSTDLLHLLHRQSMLTKYAFEIKGSQIQVFEINVDISGDDTLSRVYADLMALEREDVKFIIVEGVAHSQLSEEVLTRLAHDSQIRKRDAPELKKSRVSESLGKYLQILLFGGAVFAILVAGERNLFSSQMRYQTEPMANVGQWAPAIGTALAVLGSVWVLLADAVQKERRAMYSQEQRNLTMASKVLRQVAKGLIGLSDLLRPARKHFDDSVFKRSTAKYPTTPGQHWRDEDLDRTMTKYAGSTRASDDSIRSMPSGTPSTNPIERKRSNTGPREGERHRSGTLEIPRQLSPVCLPQRSSTQDGLSSSPLTLEPVSTLHGSRDLNTPDIVIQTPGKR